MTRKDARYYLQSSGFSEEQIDTIEQAFKQEPCEWGRMTFDATTGISVFEFSDGTIKQVKQAELEPCDDAVSRDAVLEKAVYTETEEGWCGYTVDVDYIKSLPPAPHKSGKWIYRRGDKYSCSKCSTTTSVDEAGIDEKPMYKFCPYCGAKMESEE